MTFPQALVTRFFQLINNRHFAEAQRELQRLKAEMQETQWNGGYHHALNGMLLARKANGNQYTFMSNIDPKDKGALASYQKEFSGHIENRFHEDFDRGFFSAWSHYIQLIQREAQETEHQEDIEAQTSITQYSEHIEEAK